MVSQAEQPEVGRVVDGKYRLTRLLGRGGMGSVWEGVHTTLGTRFALKYIDAAFAERKDVQTRFTNEALAAARLKSKHIVEVYDHGVDEQGSAYIVMEYLSGEPLDEKLAREKTLSLADATKIVVQMARALQRAHQAGIVHRDLKPENVFLVWDEEDKKTVVKVVDFGIAKFTDGTDIDTATRTGAVMGTPHFMSPEQARGLKTVDFAADVWSVGVIAYRCVTGRPPFDGEAVGDLLVKICTVEHPPPSTFVKVPPEFDEWVARSLAKDPSQRFASAAEQGKALSDIVAEDHPSVMSAAASLDVAPPPAPERTPAIAGTPRGSESDTAGGLERPRSARANSGRRWLLPGVAVVVAGGAAVAFVGLDSADKHPPPSGAVASSTMAPSTGLGASQGAPVLPLPAPPPASSKGSRAPDAGALAAPSVVIGRPADSPAGSLRQHRPPRTTAPPSRSPKPTTPKDELGY